MTVQRPFERAERDALRTAVTAHGVNNWQHVANELAAHGFPGRTPMGCHRCWRSVVEPEPADVGDGQRSSWTNREDAALLAAMMATGDCNDWDAVARRLPGKDRKQCFLRWTYALDPSMKKGKWTAEEDERLRQLVRQNGPHNWGKWVPTTMPGRSVTMQQLQLCACGAPLPPRTSPLLAPWFVL